MKRREFILGTAYGVGAVWLGASGFAAALPRRFSATDAVMIGKTGIKTSRLAMGTGTVGVGHHSNQTALGLKGLSELLLNGYDHGLRLLDAADFYGVHAMVGEGVKHIRRRRGT